MDLYRRKSWWKISLLIIGIIIVLLTMIYTNYLSKKMAENERKYIEFYELALKNLSNISENSTNSFSELNQDVSLPSFIIQSIKNPIILDDGSGKLDGANWGEANDTSQVFLKEMLIKIKKGGISPILPTKDQNIDENSRDIYPRIYYKHSDLYTLITWFPLVQVFMVAIFILYGYMIFNSMRRAEQNRVWAGMAKETAHQLGTPISSMMGWIEFLKSMTSLSQDQKEAVNELENDVAKLELVADRFSKIGSSPVLKNENLSIILKESIGYIKKRSPQNIIFEYEENNISDLNYKINAHLFTWVIENLLRNALDSMEGKGKIRIELSKTSHGLNIDISDSGKGIPQGKFKTVFKPGYSTKKRGWGLGLSFGKRIIEEYHKGKIYVLRSKVNEGTTFRITLPEIKSIV